MGRRLAIAVVCLVGLTHWSGCRDGLTPDEMGELIEDPAQLPSAGEPYPLPELDRLMQEKEAVGENEPAAAE